MNRRILIPAALVVPTLALSLAAHAQAPSAEEIRLREQLRSTVLELRQLKSRQDELQAQLQAAQQQLQAQGAQSAQARQSADVLQGRNLALASQNEQLKSALAQWQAAQKQAVEVAHARDVDARQLQDALTKARAEQQVCHNDNVELVSVGQELLDAWNHKGYRDVFKASEPLTGLGRVRFETLAQTYHVRIVDATLPPADAGEQGTAPAGSAAGAPP